MTRSAATALGPHAASGRSPAGPDAGPRPPGPAGPAGASFRKAAGVVRRRVLLARWLGLLGRTAVPLFAAGLAVFGAALGIAQSVESPTMANRYNGYMDELAIWNVALSPEQVLTHALGGAAGYGLTPDATPPPIAAAGGPYSVRPGETASFDASASSDPDGGDLAYAWDLNGDGSYDDAAGETCPVWPGEPITAHWSLPDPAYYPGTEEERLEFALRVAQRLRAKIEGLLELDWSGDRVELTKRHAFLGEI